MLSIKKFFDAANQSATAVNRKIIDITQRNLNLSLDLAKSLASARNPFEIVTLLASTWRKQVDELTTQAEEVRNRLFGFSSVEPETPEPWPESDPQETAKLKKGHSPAVLTPDTGRLRPNSCTQHVAPSFARTGGSGVRAPNERRLRSRKEGTAEKRSTRLQGPKSLSRDPSQRGEQKPQAAKTKFKARPSSGPVTPAAARADHEGKSKTHKEGATKVPVPQNLSTDIKFGMLDGNPVRFTNLEAWWLVNGAWRQISPGEVLSNAAVMRKARFKQLFPQVPLLPSNAFQSDKR
jgi:Phasin protein